MNCETVAFGLAVVHDVESGTGGEEEEILELYNKLVPVTSLFGCCKILRLR